MRTVSAVAELLHEAATLSQLAFACYTPPFRYDRGYIFDANWQMVSDNDSVEEHVAQRIRGWGVLSYLPRGAEIQDEIGRMVAEALTAYWADHSGFAKGGYVAASNEPAIAGVVHKGTNFTNGI